MSCLSYIGEYGSSSEDSDENSKGTLENAKKKVKLPTPNLKDIPVVATEDHVDDPDLHKGRARAFPHVRGNWASYVYIKYPEEDNLSNLIDKFLAECPNSGLQVCDDFHISLSRTVALRYHLITPFTKLLQDAVDGLDSFDLGFESVKIYCNEENNRTFVSLAVDHFSNRYLLKLVKRVDEILADYKLPTFYDLSQNSVSKVWDTTKTLCTTLNKMAQNPSLHMSILWTNGNKKSELAEVLEKFNNILYLELQKSIKTLTVDKVNCKIGNKFYQFSLQ